jgi:hypothetical protein
MGARLSLFLDDNNQEAASFAIRLMQHKLKIDPKGFEICYPNKSTDLKRLYLDLCSKRELKLFKNFANEYDLRKQAASIGKELISECRRTFLANRLFGTDVTRFRQSFLNKITPLVMEKEYSKDEKENLHLLSHFIRYQIIDPSIAQRAELASLALNKYPTVFQNEGSVNLIREAYKKVQLIENTDLDSACQKFLIDWDTLNKSKSAELENLELTHDTKEEEMSAQQIINENCKLRPGTPLKII